MSLLPHKKEENDRFLNLIDKDQIEISTQNEKSPEFDEIGTPLNDL